MVKLFSILIRVVLYSPSLLVETFLFQHPSLEANHDVGFCIWLALVESFIK